MPQQGLLCEDTDGPCDSVLISVIGREGHWPRLRIHRLQPGLVSARRFLGVFPRPTRLVFIGGRVMGWIGQGAVPVVAIATNPQIHFRSEKIKSLQTDERLCGGAMSTVLGRFGRPRPLTLSRGPVSPQSTRIRNDRQGKRSVSCSDFSNSRPSWFPLKSTYLSCTWQEIKTSGKSSQKQRKKSVQLGLKGRMRISDCGPHLVVPGAAQTATPVSGLGHQQNRSPQKYYQSSSC